MTVAKQKIVAAIWLNSLKALELDSLSSSHPIEVEVQNPADINQIFDTISYCKVGGSFLYCSRFCKGGAIFLKSPVLIVDLFCADCL